MRAPSKAVCERVHAEELARRGPCFDPTALVQPFAQVGWSWKVRRTRGTHWIDLRDPDGINYGSIPVTPEEAEALRAGGRP